MRSDQCSFIRQGIPALAFKVGYRPGTPGERTWQGWLRDHYHTPNDDVTQLIDRDEGAAFNVMYAALALQIANRATCPAWRPTSVFATPAR